MRQNGWNCLLFGTGFLSLVIVAAFVSIPLGIQSPAAAQQPKNEELAAGLQYVPTDAALFVYADTGAIWNNSIFQALRKSDQKFFDGFVSMAKSDFGSSPEDVKSIVAFVPTLKNPGEMRRFGLAVTFCKGYDKDKIFKGTEQLLSKDGKVKVVPVDEHLVLVLVGLGEEFAKPQPIGKAGPLTAALKEAATGKHVAVFGTTLASLPDEIRADDVPAQIRPFQPLSRAQTITAALDIGKTIDVDVRVKTETAGQAVDCEKSLGVLLTLIQDTLGDGIKEVELDAVKIPGLKDIVTIMKAGSATAKEAKLSTLGTEVKLTASLSADLPFSTAYLAAKQKLLESAAGTRSANNLKQIGLAMHSYHDTNNAFPPAAVCDKKGNPQLSWRVLILPYIEQDKLFKEFKLDEPWDSEHNKKLLAKMPNVYAMPGKTKDGDTDTYYRVFVGKGAGFDWIVGTNLLSITDGLSNTIMCVTAAKAVPWTKPDELEFDPEKDMTKLLGAFVNGKVQAAFFDGSVRSFGKIPDKMTLNALITRDGGEVIPEIP